MKSTKKGKAKPKVDVMEGLSRIELIPPKGNKFVSVYQSPKSEMRSRGEGPGGKGVSLCKGCVHYLIDECDHKFWYEKHTNCPDFKPKADKLQGGDGSG
jgi:hypothetical protein